MSVELVPAFPYPEEVAVLFGEYTDMLVEGDPAFKAYLDLQNYDDELLHLEHKYGPPGGRLYLARENGAAIGCIGLRRIDDENCELNRLYVVHLHAPCAVKKGIDSAFSRCYDTQVKRQ